MIVVCGVVTLIVLGSVGTTAHVTANGLRSLDTLIDEEGRLMVEEGARLEQRFAIRPRPYATFCAPPKHVQSEAVEPGLLHATSAWIPW